MDDDAMLRLMTDENATQAGSSPGAVMNEVAAVIRRLIGGLMENTAPIVAVCISKAFEDQRAIETARGRLQKRAAEPGADVPIGERVIAQYLGQGDQNVRTVLVDKSVRLFPLLNNLAGTMRSSTKHCASIRCRLPVSSQPMMRPSSQGHQNRVFVCSTIGPPISLRMRLNLLPSGRR
jgi:hypothetical protein